MSEKARAEMRNGLIHTNMHDKEGEKDARQQLTLEVLNRNPRHTESGAVRQHLSWEVKVKTLAPTCMWPA